MIKHNVKQKQEAILNLQITVYNNEFMATKQTKKTRFFRNEVVHNLPFEFGWGRNKKRGRDQKRANKI